MDCLSDTSCWVVVGHRALKIESTGLQDASLFHLHPNRFILLIQMLCPINKLINYYMTNTNMGNANHTASFCLFKKAFLILGMLLFQIKEDRCLSNSLNKKLGINYGTLWNKNKNLNKIYILTVFTLPASEMRNKDHKFKSLVFFFFRHYSEITSK